MARGRPRKTTGAKATEAKVYKHEEAKVLLRPEVGTQAQFKKKKPPQKYRYDDSLSPALEWDEKNPARERGEALLKEVLDAATLEQAKDAAAKLKAMSSPFLNWAGKAERRDFEVTTLPLFVHERLSTKAIVETLKTHKKDKGVQLSLLDMFADPQRPIADQVLKAYEYKDDWVNRLILGDSLVVMNSLLHYEGLGGQVQMIYMDPPYGVKFGSNFQPFVRKRGVRHGDDEDMTREPEMVQAYRDTWTLGIHSYLTYLRERLMLARDLLSPTGSVFVQISDENVHHVRELMDEVFGQDNFAGIIQFAKTAGLGSSRLSTVADYLLWYGRDLAQIRYQPLYLHKVPGEAGGSQYTWAELPNGRRLNLASGQEGPLEAPPGSRIFVHDNITSQRPRNPTDVAEFEFEGRRFTPGTGVFKTDIEGLRRLAATKRLMVVGNTLRYVRYLEDFPVFPLANLWTDTGTSGFASDKLYVVQTLPKVIERCMLMTSCPGDLVLDPTCGGGTTAYVAEQWGRRWITIDTSRVPLALARQRLLTATFSWYELADEKRGPVAGFVYKPERESMNPKSIGPGIVPHVTLRSVANDEPPQQEVLVDRPELDSKVTRVSGPFVVEATIPTPIDWDGDNKEDSGVGAVAESYGTFVDRMLEVLRKSPVIQVAAGKTVEFKNVRQPAKTLSLSAEAVVANGKDKPVAVVFGPENGAVSEKLVYEAAKEAAGKGYAHLYVIGFQIQPNARQLVETCDAAMGVSATYVQMTPDVMMGDLLKNTRASQIFSVCGLPEVRLKKVAPKKYDDPARYQVELLGLDIFDPVEMKAEHEKGDNVPAWFLDTDYNGLCFHVNQAFFPRTNAWDNLRRALKATHAESVWDHLAGTKSEPFEAGNHGTIAVKVVDDRGNELLVTRKLSEAEG